MQQSRLVETEWYRRNSGLIQIITLAHVGMPVLRLEEEPQVYPLSIRDLNSISAPMYVREESPYARR